MDKIVIKEPDIKAGLAHKRLNTDKATQSERIKVDEALDRNGSVKDNIIKSLIDHERQGSDKSLQDERKQTDSAAQESLLLLSQEKKSHAKTQIALTTRDEFLAIVSHDLRNPIGFISSCAEVLLDDLTENQNPTKMKKMIGMIKRNADSALRLISDLLDMERLSQGRLQLQLKHNNLKNLLDETAEVFSLQAKGLDLELKVSPFDHQLQVSCDRDRVLQILSNLIGNALKFTPAGGTITLTADKKENEVQICVTDTGPGIADEKKKDIFNRFAQIGEKDRSGLGLGLYISKMLVEAHSGSLWVVSNLGEGSSFCFTLPRAID